MTLPNEILTAIATPGGGQIALVLGAGCSVDEPTGLPPGAACSQYCFDQLVANGVLEVGDCGEPENLSALADAVVAKRGTQRPLVEIMMQHFPFKSASPNHGYLLAAALMSEKAVSAIVTLNFDLAISGAIAQLGVSETIGIIEAPEELGRQKTINVYYLHRNANASDPDTLVLRTQAIRDDWRTQWEGVVAGRVLSNPLVIFVGLGSPADVLVETATLIKSRVPAGTDLFLIDPSDRATSAFSRALNVPADHYVQLLWSDFMDELSERLTYYQVDKLSAAAARLTAEAQTSVEDLTVLRQRLNEIGLIGLGSLRARWILHPKNYLADSDGVCNLVADLLLVAAFIARNGNVLARPSGDGVVDFHRVDGRIVPVLFASGGGTRPLAAVITHLARQRRRLQDRPMPVQAAVVSATSDGVAAHITPPSDITGPSGANNIVAGNWEVPVLHAQQLRQDPTLCAQLIS